MRNPGFCFLPFLLVVTSFFNNCPAYAADTPVAVVTRFAASEGPETSADGRALSRITLSFVTPRPDGIWMGIEVYVPSANGPLLVASGATSPLSFALETAGQPVTLFAVSVTRDGRRSSFDASPSAEVVLDRIASPPVPVSNFGAQVVGAAARLSWSENVDGDVVRYEIARLPESVSVAAHDNVPVTAIIPAAGEGATQKATWDDHPSSENQDRQYFVRAVNSSGQISDWASVTLSADPAVSNLAPDGSSDSGVPNWNVYQSLGASVPGNGLVTFFISPGSRWNFNINSPLNNHGITTLWVKVYYTGGDGQGSRTYRFADNGAQVLAPDATRTFSIELPDAQLLGEEHWFENYFGQGSHQGLTYPFGRSTGPLLRALLLPSAASFSAVADSQAIQPVQTDAPPADPPLDPSAERVVRARYYE